MGEAARRKKAGTYPEQVKPWSPGVLPKNDATNSMPTTPTLPLSAHVLAFARSLSAEEPLILPFTDVGEGYEAGSCHLNVAHRVKHHGGRRVSGWMIWTSSKFTDGEFHAVWESPTGEMLDITPRRDGESFIVFVADPVSKLIPQGVGAVIPVNRTTIPGMPFTFGTRVSRTPAQYREPDVGTVIQMQRLGMTHFVGP